MVKYAFRIAMPTGEEVLVTEKIAQGIPLYELQFRAEAPALTIYQAPNGEWWENGIGYSKLAAMAGAAIQTYQST